MLSSWPSREVHPHLVRLCVVVRERFPSLSRRNADRASDARLSSEAIAVVLVFRRARYVTVQVLAVSIRFLTRVEGEKRILRDVAAGVVLPWSTEN